MTAWQPAYIGIGSNLDDPRRQVAAALARLGQLPRTRLVLASPLYGSRPMGPVDQPDFVNAAAGVLTQLDAAVLLRELRAIEVSLGRTEARERWGPRVLDLDLLVYGQEQRADPQLTLPHPGIAERSFVLTPLAAIAPDLEVPGIGRVSALAARLSGAGIWAL